MFKLHAVCHQMNSHAPLILVVSCDTSDYLKAFGKADSFTMIFMLKCNAAKGLRSDVLDKLHASLSYRIVLFNFKETASLQR